MKKRVIKSALPIYGIALMWLLAGIAFPLALLKIWFLLIMAALSVGVYLVLSKVFPPRVVEERSQARSGDKEIDTLIETGRKQLDSLIAANNAIPDAAISSKLDRMVKAGEGIFDTLERDTSKAVAVRRFMSYYLPTTEKLMNSYRMMMNTQGGENITSAMRSVESSLEMIASAFEKQLDNLFKDSTLDIETDIDVLETMMSGDGLTDTGIKREI